MPPKEADEWEDVPDGAEEEEEEDISISNPDVVMKYKKAATWANEVLAEVIGLAKAGAAVPMLCEAGDAAILARVQTMFRGVEKGIAFPTCISVNNCVCHNSPAASPDERPEVLAEGDVVHIDLGVHIDGYCAVVAHTIVVTTAEELPDSKAAQVIAAAYATLQAALRRMRPGTPTYDVTNILEKSAAHFGLTVVDGVLSHMMKRYIIDGIRCIPGKKVPEQLVHGYDLEAGQVWTLDVALTSGRGKLREGDTRCSIYKTALDTSYATKMQSAREVQREIDEKFQSFPFAVRNLANKKARLGLSEMIKHGVVAPYPVLFEREGEVVAHFKVTVLITPKKIEKVTGLPVQKTAVKLSPFTDPLLLETSKLPLSLEEKKAKTAVAAAAPAQPKAA